MSQTFTNWKNDPVHFTVACASKLNMCVALHSVNDPRSIYDYEALLLYFFALADLGLRPRARTTHPPHHAPPHPHSPFCDVFYYIWRILSKIKSIHIAGGCRGHPFLNFWIRSWFYLVFFLCRSLLAITRQWNRENFAISSVKLRSDV